MKLNKSLILFVLLISITTIHAEQNLNVDKQNCLIIFKIESDIKSDFGLTLTKEDKLMTQNPDKQILLNYKKNFVLFKLKSGKYYFSYGGVGRLLVMINKSTKKVDIKDNVINYLGTFYIKLNSKTLDIEINQINTEESFTEAIEILKSNYSSTIDTVKIENSVIEQ